MTEREQQRLVKLRLAVLRHASEVTGNICPNMPVIRDQRVRRSAFSTRGPSTPAASVRRSLRLVTEGPILDVYVSTARIPNVILARLELVKVNFRWINAR